MHWVVTLKSTCELVAVLLQHVLIQLLAIVVLSHLISPGSFPCAKLAEM